MRLKNTCQPVPGDVSDFYEIIRKPLFRIVFQMVLECLFISNFQDLEKSMKTLIKPIFSEKNQRKHKENQYFEGPDWEKPKKT